MIRLIARFIAKQQYIFKLEHEGASNDINAQLATKRAQEKRAYIEQLNKDADAIEENIAKEELKLENGYWLCDNGHDSATQPKTGLLAEKFNGIDVQGPVCECGASTKYMKLSLLTGQEKYEADREKDDAKKIAAEKRRVAEAESTNVSEGEKTAQSFRNMAQNSRLVADKIRHL